jgi:hypothetical protein
MMLNKVKISVSTYSGYWVKRWKTVKSILYLSNKRGRGRRIWQNLQMQGAKLRQMAKKTKVRIWQSQKMRSSCLKEHSESFG